MKLPLILLLAQLPLIPCLQAGPAPDAGSAELIFSDVLPFQLGESVPGLLEVNPDHALPLLFTPERSPFVAAGNTLDGRIGAFAHAVFLSADLWEEERGIETLVTNVIRWAGQSSTPSVGLAPEIADLKPLLTRRGMEVQILNPSELQHQVDVYCFIGQAPLSTRGIEALKRFSLKGGGVVVAATPWAFVEQYPEFEQFPANEVAPLAGIQFLPEGYAPLEEGYLMLTPSDSSE